jgi:uncharacterized protein
MSSGHHDEWSNAMRLLPERPTLGDLISRRMGRRDWIKGALATAVLSSAGCAQPEKAAKAAAVRGFKFEEIARGVDERHHVAPGYRADVLIRWGDPLTGGAPAFEPDRQSAQAQEQQFGYNNDYLGFIPLNADRALLCVNHEYTIPTLMFPGLTTPQAYTPEHAQIEMAAHGLSVVELKKASRGWAVVDGSRYNRRVSGRSGRFQLSGPAAGHARLRTRDDPGAEIVIGTLNNCAGGVTPWGTYVSGEENVDNYFDWSGDTAPPGEEANFFYFALNRSRYLWHQSVDRFSVAKEPLECNRFGWVVELDPKDPQSTPKKRTALGRFKHEGAESIVNSDGKVVVYMGDDERFQCVYRFITAARFDPANPAANQDLLDDGVLSVARFNADGTLDWLPLVHGSGPLIADNGFASQADVVIEARRAAALLGGTPMDRPEDVQPHPSNGRVYVMLTNNNQRTKAQIDAANPREANEFGHIVELTAPAGDHGAASFRWDILIKAGNPADPEVGALFNPATSSNGWFASPDNCAIDPSGRLWVATDQGSKWDKTLSADGLYAVDTDTALRGTSRMFFRCPVGAELCGPQFDSLGETLFLAVQHPAADVVQPGPGIDPRFSRPSTYEQPATRWPDFDPEMPPRPSVVMITQDSGGPIGTA